MADWHVAVHLMPAAMLFATFTDKVAVPPIAKEAGGETNAMESGSEAIDKVALLAAEGAPVTEEVIVTVPPKGITEGAV